MNISNTMLSILQENKQLKQENEQLQINQLSIQNTCSITQAKSDCQVPAELCDDGSTLIGESRQINEIKTQIRRFSNSPLMVFVQEEFNLNSRGETRDPL